MKALVYHGPGNKAWEEVEKPTITSDTDAIVRVDAVTICGTDLHILKGDVPEVVDGRILGHEAVGTVEQVGSGVKRIRPGDRVLVSCITSCGTCRFCREQRYGQCLGGGGWILGHLIDGTQAEYVRVPFADTSTYALPAEIDDESALMVADILPTSYEVGVLNGHVAPGDVVAIVGAGPIGLSAIIGARLYSPSHVVAIDLASSRRDAAKRFGADVTIDPEHEDAEAIVRELTNGLGADVSIEAVGTPEAFELTVRLARGRSHRQHRRARQAGDTAPRGAVDQGRHNHDWPRRHVFHTHVLATARRASARRVAIRDTPFRARPVHRGVRRVRSARRDGRAQGRVDPHGISIMKGSVGDEIVVKPSRRKVD